MPRPRKRAPSAGAAPRRLPAAAAVLLFAAVVLAAAAWLRPIDGDEGYYAAATRLVVDGARPYADFFYPQAPLLPWVYAPVEALVGPDLRALRLLSALFTWAALVTWAAGLGGGLRRPTPAAAVALAVAAFSPDLVSWGVTVKTYAVTGLLATGALVLVGRAAARTGARAPWLLASGLAAGLAASSRLFYAPLGPVLAAGLVLWPGEAGRRQAAREAGLLLAGFAVGCAPLAAAWLQNPAVFVFNNLGYHELRFSELRDSGAEPYLLHRAWAGLRDTALVFATNPYLLACTVLAVFGIRSLPAASTPHGRLGRLSALVSGVFLLASMTPDPVYAQYFTAPLILLAVPLFAAAMDRLAAGGARRLAAAAAAALALGAGVMAVGRPGMDPDPAWTFASYDAVVHDIRERTSPNDVVLSFWPGYVYGSGRRYLPGMENQFAVGVSERLERRDLVRYRIADRRRLADAFRRREARIVVLGTWMNELNTALDDPQMIELLKVFQPGYRTVGIHGEVLVCESLP